MSDYHSRDLYLRRAQELRSLAEALTQPEHAATLVAMAVQYERLASRSLATVTEVEAAVDSGDAL